MAFFALFFGTWAVFAIFAGSAVAMTMDERRSAAQRSLPLAAAGLGFADCLVALSENSFPGSVTRLILSVSCLLFLFSSVIAFWLAAEPVGRTFRVFSVVSLILACLWFSSSGIVTPVLWGPPGFDRIRVAFAVVVLAVVFGSFFAIHAAGKRRPVPQARTRLGSLVLFVVGVLAMLAIVFSATAQTLWENHERQRSSDLYRAMSEFGNRLKMLQVESDAILPADLQARSARAYLNRLQAREPGMADGLDLSRVRIANVGRGDPPGTIFLRSDDDECDLNILMDVIGGPPHYPRGWFALSKDGNLWFYQHDGSSFPALPPPPKMTDPPRFPAFLPSE
jgi:hypothetical protein